MGCKAGRRQILSRRGDDFGIVRQLRRQSVAVGSIRPFQGTSSGRQSTSVSYRWVTEFGRETNQRTDLEIRRSVRPTTSFCRPSERVSHQNPHFYPCKVLRNGIVIAAREEIEYRRNRAAFVTPIRSHPNMSHRERLLLLSSYEKGAAFPSKELKGTPFFGLCLSLILIQTFRDTDACREMVIDYTCLWWGSENEMYDNRCGIEAQVLANRM